MAIISTEKQYKHSKKTVSEMLAEEENSIKIFKEQGGSRKDVEKLLAPVRCLRMQIEEEIEEYEAIKNGNIPEYMKKIENIGLLLIALRIKQGWTQTRLAKELGVPQSQVSRDERNEYYGVSTKTINKHLSLYNTEIKLELS